MVVHRKRTDDFLVRFEDAIKNNFFNFDSFEDFMEEKGFQLITDNLVHPMDFVNEYPEGYKHCTDGLNY